MTSPSEALVSRQHGRSLTVDIYPPSGTALDACVILLHGGAWMFGHRSDMAPQARALAAEGFTCIAAEYRLSTEAVWPAQLQDITDVVAWARTQAGGLGFSPDRIALLGASAGGHLALMAAGHVAAVVAICAPPELRLPPAAAGPNPIAALLGPMADGAVARGASPLAHVSASLPPVCLIGGGKDTLVPSGMLLGFAGALVAAGVAVDLHLYHGHEHGFDMLPSMSAVVQSEVCLFLKRAVANPDHYAHESETLNPFARPGALAMPHPAPVLSAAT